MARAARRSNHDIGIWQRPDGRQKLAAAPASPGELFAARAEIVRLQTHVTPAHTATIKPTHTATVKPTHTPTGTPA